MKYKNADNDNNTGNFYGHQIGYLLNLIKQVCALNLIFFFFVRIVWLKYAG